MTNKTKEELLKGLSEKQIAKAKACKNSEELLALAKEEGIELTDEQLEAVSGGCKTSGHGDEWFRGGTCPKCGGTNTVFYEGTWSHGATMHCYDCGYDSLDN